MTVAMRTGRTLSLPDDIILSEILIRLPARSLLRFRSVCKLWRSTVCDPAFIKSHCTTLNPNDDDDYVLSETFVHCEHGRCANISLLFSNSLSKTSLYCLSDSLHLLGSINGILCISSDLNSFALWNPALRQAKKFYPPHQYRYDEYPKVYLSGFCWDAAEDDFKVVISYKHKRTYSYSGPCFSSYVYSCNSDSWTSLPISPFSESTASYSWNRSVIVNGMPHWTCLRYCDQKNLHVSSLMKFEAGSNEFKMLTDFVDVFKQYAGYFNIVNLKECIFALVYSAELSEGSLDVYCLDDRCGGVWSKIYNVGPGHVDTLSQCFKYGGKTVFINARGKLMCYDGTTNEIKGLGNIKTDNLYNCFSYKASLVFIQGMKLSPKGYVDIF